VSFSNLFDEVKTRLTAATVDATVVFGKREVTKQINQGPGRANRVVFVPGDEAGALGAYEPVREPGPNLRSRVIAGGRRTPRSLWDWHVAGRVYVWAFDGTAPEDERKQWDAMVELHDYVVEAIHGAASGNYKIRAPKDPAKTVERRFGCETMFVVELRQPVLATAGTRTAGAVVGSGETVLGESGTEPGC